MKSPVFRPAFALFNALAAVALLFVVGELIEQRSGKCTAPPAVLISFGFAAGFHRAALTPKGLFHLYAAFASHLFSVSARAAQDAAS